MISVEFLGPLSTEGVMELQVSSMQELKAVLQENPKLTKWLGVCAVAVNDGIIKDSTYRFKDGDKVMILPPVCGG
ncbi:MAG: MoaD/ThiS family protein [Helicobacter sp.]|uniref:MoaD/ThiS family protein n=1 Tax=Helicobacter sp. 10-6591 TaxID=2004998 RepID=UPI000DCBC348|nr:MoaD/ThiS family protein [Helicobacter sp. 10-6591]MCI6218107.1 MoaD/ThiS family protein [Helicobacter sp.]MDD7566902.1 MoaD/ThiS family protein [Helicobacter sp.]MDY5740713.1 MoaD/ThiS family protein [Helicobacter sp.]RAX53935.1 molybdopterin synthase sulfur carrier subunit [Helicobacter sp. 10-6591]